MRSLVAIALNRRVNLAIPCKALAQPLNSLCYVSEHMTLINLRYLQAAI